MKPYYQHEDITIYHGDCREILPMLEPVDLVLTSPPYIDQRIYGRAGYPAEKDAWLSWLVSILMASLNLAPSAIFNIGDRRREGIREWDASDFAARARASNIQLWERFIWLKYPYLPNGSSVQPDDVIEFILWFGRPEFKTDAVRRKYAPSTLTRYQSPPSLRHESDGTRRRQANKVAHPDGSRPTTVLTMPALETDEFTGHPAQFPLALPLWFIAASTSESQTVLDPFMGSGTTLRAAKDLGRKAIGIEIEERYCEIAAKRMAQEVLHFQ